MKYPNQEPTAGKISYKFVRIIQELLAIITISYSETVNITYQTSVKYQEVIDKFTQYQHNGRTQCCHSKIKITLLPSVTTTVIFKGQLT